MDWLNLHISKTHSQEFRLADERIRGVWISLLAYCVSQENSGIIDNCEVWSVREWQQLCGVSKRVVDADSSLWSWLDGSLIVKFYPVEKQHEVQHLRARAKAAADARWHAPGNANGHASGMPSGNAEGKGKGREGKERGTHSPLASVQANRQRVITTAKRKRLAWDDDAITELLGLARDMGCKTTEQTTDLIEWATDKTRESNPDARYARHLQAAACEWRKMKQETERISKESA